MSSSSRVVSLTAMALMLAVMGSVAAAASDQVSFATAKSYAAGKVPYDVTSADFDGDGRQDLAVADDGGTFTDGSVQVLFNEGSGTFGEPTSYDDFKDTPRGITSADYNGDGKPDIAVSNFNDGQVEVLINQGRGLFPGIDDPTFEVGIFPYDITSADFNRDGNPDLAVVNSNEDTGNPGTVSVLINRGDGTYPKDDSPFYTVGYSPRGITSADFSGDGDPDIAVTNRTYGTVSVLTNRNGTFPQSATSDAGDSPLGITSTDLNGDGRPDLATANGGSSFGASNVSVLLNTTELTETARCTITGTGRDDVLEGTGGRDIICGRGGDDRIKGSQGDDEILGGRDDDAINGGAGNDVLRGGRGEDRLVGAGGSDALYGGSGVDRCARGNDRETGCEKP